MKFVSTFEGLAKWYELKAFYGEQDIATGRVLEAEDAVEKLEPTPPTPEVEGL